ncbi:PucR family transcriptional regulator [Jiangella muralis]|uniref:PucR family transcriptional regulator n=1 Tax=Jiangella muralis TaxID=702383 RepID=UPI00069D5E8C|nr:helix-turn-helix domain-containing protein [Jiangella muralis]
MLERTSRSGPEGWLTTPVGTAGRRWARLALPHADPADEERHAMVLERAAAALELARMAERDQLALELQAQGGFLAEIAAERLTRADAAVRAQSLGLPSAPAYVAAVAQPGDQHVRDLVERLAARVRSARLDALIGPLNERQVGLILAQPSTRRPALIDRLVDALDGADVVLGVTDPEPDIAGAGAQLRHAAQVAEAASSMSSLVRLPYYRSSDVRLAGLLALLHDDPRLQGFVESELGGLLAHDAEHDDGLVDVLREYVNLGGSKTRLSERIHLSRPAVYKKLARIARITGFDLDRPESLLSIGVAVTAYDLHHRLTRAN